ncbi:hypothetical protein TPHA_0D00530 [Tetrapisispora phaffii CBS 4417]|uniref:Small nuclear ribonucleoprotein G n=1 Tax=Tetrapisispora phaffii (strain ATCC 24235 / CBS 4417 / NBRC 1672 / NRRL Y-8282 / UCD 70-5) TaxID=1071381 RepID=G8BS76_TETPH|nr:hypothetical protein TPHA_0D00530 [Tetrapisispora phaffii CBS 4417]CCE62697.1 hypothetical protein TPHA_0D00530 [Tetrapisispora phaffii CBS 4417]
MVSAPELKKYLEKKIVIKLNGERRIAGVLRGYDVFLNVVVDDAVEVSKNGTSLNLGSQTVVRGNSILSIEALDTLV